MQRALFLFEHIGLAAEPFTKTGWETFAVDILNQEANPRVTHSLNWDIIVYEPELIKIAKTCEFIFGFPPCTDLAASGAGHFTKKLTEDLDFQFTAYHEARSVERIGTESGKPWALENPIGVLSSLWRKPDFIFNPFEYGGWLPLNDTHPLWPKYIKPRDAYRKTTCLWTGNFFPIPDKWLVPVEAGWSQQATLLGGKSPKTKLIRSASPRGFFTALCHKMSGVQYEW